ncbi:hypothetical protein E4U13_008027 [Claviceps humidiphila]|uniref:Nudix hydrolase domain-containing protein n=1 Tax=Claviceps humidiphila TaxID=1294629 RepID=A0A9P7TW81_9HYPO|nr:hypothetical protein E4U13_008027 [Claviceps humidiphila]
MKSSSEIAAGLEQEQGREQEHSQPQPQPQPQHQDNQQQLEIQTPFAFSTSLAHFTVPASQYISLTYFPWHEIATSALLFNNISKVPKILLLLRASPPEWQLPGGPVDDTRDASILHSLVRDVHEETGLKVVNVQRAVSPPIAWPMSSFAEETVPVPQGFWNSSRTKLIARFMFEVQVAEGGDEGLDGDDGVVLDERQYRDWMWATEEEVYSSLTLTPPDQRRIILEGFKLRERFGA